MNLRDFWLYIAIFLFGLWCSAVWSLAEWTESRLSGINCEQAVVSTLQPHHTLNRIARSLPVVHQPVGPATAQNNSELSRYQHASAIVGPYKWRRFQ